MSTDHALPGAIEMEAGTVQMGMISKATWLVLLFAMSFSGHAQSGEKQPLFTDFADLLADHLQLNETPEGGRLTAFDYESALADERTARRLSRQRNRLAEFDTDTLEGRAQSTAFWINAYNFFMLNHILGERPDGELVETVWDYGGRYNPFRKNVFERELFDIGGQQYSLDQIEKEILLGEAFKERGWKDARVHFAVNCAAVGCPPLYPTPYSADEIDRQLDENTRLSLLTHRQLQIEGDTLRVSRLFDWYQDDFVEDAGSIRSFLESHVPAPLTESISQTERIEYIEYDWSLNRPDNFPEFQ